MSIYHSGFIAYADDICLLASSSDTHALKQNCEGILFRAAEFFNSHDLFFNTQKTQGIWFHNYQRKSVSFQLSVANTILQTTHSRAKFLGMYLDEHLNWSLHCEDLISRLNSLHYMFRNLKTVLNIKQLVSIYFAQAALWNLLVGQLNLGGGRFYCTKVYFKMYF